VWGHKCLGRMWLKRLIKRGQELGLSGSRLLFQGKRGRCLQAVSLEHDREGGDVRSWPGCAHDTALDHARNRSALEVTLEYL
jgi:hypothetical protein